jgi:hypothetical protein
VNGYLELPGGWRRAGSRGPWPFTTGESFEGPGGERVEWGSRAHRKGAPSSMIRCQLGRREWWMAGLFSIGALCFAVGGIASQWSIGVSGHATARIFFAGSIFFTSAAYLQYSEAVNAERGLAQPHQRPAWRAASWEPKRIDWWATLIQLIGTVLFNLSTGLALGNRLSPGQTDVRVWAPDIFGSIAFLLSSQLAFAEVCHRWFCLRRRTLSWWVVAVNLAGSVAFGVSAVSSLVMPGSGQAVNLALANGGTWVGAVMFLLGAVLLVPETSAHRRRRERRRAQAVRLRPGEDPSDDRARAAAARRTSRSVATPSSR